MWSSSGPDKIKQNVLKHSSKPLGSLFVPFAFGLDWTGFSNIKHLMTGPLGNSKFCFPRISLRFEGNKIHCSPRDQSLSDLLYSKTKQTQNFKTALRFQRSRATAVNISRVTVNCFPFDIIVFAMLPAHGIWRETVSLLDVM